MDLSLPVIKISHFDLDTLESINTKGTRGRLYRIYTLLEPKPRFGLESEQRIRNKISFELNETALAAASVMNILLCY